MKNTDYKLEAMNESGATVSYYGNTIKSVINQFDNDYRRAGFSISIFKMGGADVWYEWLFHKHIKSSFR